MTKKKLLNAVKAVLEADGGRCIVEFPILTAGFVNTITTSLGVQAYITKSCNTHAIGDHKSSANAGQ